MHSDQQPGAAPAAPPRHVAIIMDGNGRWAAARGLPRIEGHRRGVERVRGIVKHAGERGVACMTLFAFSSENWSRPKPEISDLMVLLKRYIRQDLAELHRNGVCVRVIGSRDFQDQELRALIEECEQLTRGNDRMTLAVAFNYGGQDEIARAARRIAEKAAAGELRPDQVTVDCLSAHLDTAGLPDLDLLIRTSGEKRLSNFLLWQCAYAELVFAPELWPDFDNAAFDRALVEFSRRERRFGGLSADAAAREQAAQ